MKKIMLRIEAVLLACLMLISSASITAYASAVKTPSAPVVSNTSSGVKIKWNSVKGASGYRVYKRKGSGDWKKAAQTAKTSYTDKSVTNSAQYSYRVKAYKKSKKTLWSGVSKTSKIRYVKAPSLPKLYNNADGINVKWSKHPTAKKYALYRKPLGGKKYTRIATLASTSYKDKNVKEAQRYIYTVRAYDGKAWSGCDTKGKTLCRLKTPQIKSVREYDGSIKLTYSAVKGAKSYIVMRKTGENGTYKELGKTTANSFNDKTAVSLKTYYYTVRAVNGGSKGGYQKGVKCRSSYRSGNCARDYNHEKRTKTVVAATSVLPGYTSYMCQCGACGYYKNIVKPAGEKSPDSNAFAYPEAVKRNDASVKYLNSILNNDKTDLLQIYSGSPAEHRALKKLADSVIYGCKNNSQKISAVYNWIVKNITYDTGASAFPTDVMRSRRGDCQGMANLAVDMLRLEGVPSASVDGYRGDTKFTLTENNMQKLSGAGHQWVRAYDGKKWVFLDPSYAVYNISEDEIAKYYYSIATDGAVPYYKNMNLKMTFGFPVCIGGRYYPFDGGACDYETGGCGVIADGYTYNYNAFQFDGVERYENKSVKNMRLAEIFTDDWTVEYSTGMRFGYSYYNGRRAQYAVLQKKDGSYFINNFCATLKYSGNYLTTYEGVPALFAGDTVEIYFPKMSAGEKRIWSSSNSSVAAVDSNGKVTAKKKGSVTINVKDAKRHYDYSYTFFVTDNSNRLNAKDLASANSVKTAQSKLK